MGLKLKDNSAKVEADLDRLQERIRTVALPRAINAVVPGAQTAAFRQISATYQVAPRTMALYATQRLANVGNLEASITVKGRGFPLKEFKPVQVREGVRVTVKGRTFVVPHAFIVAKFGHVFARGAYGATPKPTGQSFGRFSFGKGRLPINKLWTFGPATAFADESTVRAIDDELAQRMPKALERELGAIARGF